MHKKNITTKEIFASASQNHEKKNFKAAENLYNEILKIEPNHFESLFNLGTLLVQSKNFGKAKQLLNRAILIKPNFAHAHYNLGIVFKELNELKKAVISYQKAIEIDPNFIAAYNNLGIVFKELKEFNKAISLYKKAIETNPGYANGYYNLGIAFKELKDFKKAAISYQKAIEINPEYANAFNNLGEVQHILGEFEKAINSYQKAIEINPNHERSYNNLGNLLNNLGKYDEAKSAYNKAIKIKPDYEKAHSNHIFNLSYITDLDQNLLLSEAKKFRINCEPKKKLSFRYEYEKKPKKLRIGFVSGDFGDHPGGYFTLSTLRELKKKNFELIAYSNFDRKDKLFDHFKEVFSTWHSIEKKNDEEVVEQIFKDGIHILMELQGHSGKNRIPIFMYKPAPIQVSWLSVGTLGLPEIDYLIGSPYITPKNEENHFVEKIWRLPEITQCFTPPDFDIKIKDLPVSRNNFITFGCVNKLAKVNDDVVALWSKILSFVPNSKLLLKSTDLDNPKIIENTYKRFVKNKISNNRLILRGNSPSRKELLEVYNEIDIALDPFPFQGNTTTCEAAWMGVPVVTLKGNRFVFHFGESISANLNMHVWIAKNHEEYISKAIKFSSDIDLLYKIRKSLRKTALLSPVFDAPRFAEHFCKMLWDMWKIYNKKL